MPLLFDDQQAKKETTKLTIAAPNMQPISTTTSTPHIPHRIRMKTVRNATVRVREYPPILRILLLDDVELVNRGRTREVRGEKLRAGVRHVQRVEIRRELQAIDLSEPVRDNPDLARGGRVAVDLAGNRDGGPEVLEEAVLGVGEPDVAGDRVLLGVVEGGEVVAEVGGQEGRGLAGDGVEEGEG